ncbi:unnamed protein product, partial [Prorocentrum cordatum]
AQQARQPPTEAPPPAPTEAEDPWTRWDPWARTTSNSSGSWWNSWWSSWWGADGSNSSWWQGVPSTDDGTVWVTIARPDELLVPHGLLRGGGERAAEAPAWPGAPAQPDARAEARPLPSAPVQSGLPAGLAQERAAGWTATLVPPPPTPWAPTETGASVSTWRPSDTQGPTPWGGFERLDTHVVAIKRWSKRTGLPAEQQAGKVIDGLPMNLQERLLHQQEELDSAEGPNVLIDFLKKCRGDQDGDEAKESFVLVLESTEMRPGETYAQYVMRRDTQVRAARKHGLDLPESVQEGENTRGQDVYFEFEGDLIMDNEAAAAFYEAIAAQGLDEERAIVALAAVLDEKREKEGRLRKWTESRELKKAIARDRDFDSKRAGGRRAPRPSAGKQRLSIARLKEKTRCANCGQKGHWRKDCTNPCAPKSEVRDRGQEGAAGAKGSTRVAASSDGGPFLVGGARVREICALGAPGSADRPDQEINLLEIDGEEPEGMVDTAAGQALAGENQLRDLQLKYREKGWSIPMR